MSSDFSLQNAIDTFEQGDAASALEIMQQVLIAQPHNPIVRVEFANMLMREKRFDDARDVLNSLQDDEKNNPIVLALLGQLDAIDIVMSAPDFELLLQTIEASPENCLVREQLSAHYKLRGDYNAALEQLLYIVKTDKNYNNNAGQAGLFKIFDILGHEHELVGEYRKKLALILN